MKIEGDLPAPTLQCLLVGKFRSGARLSRRKQWASAYSEPFSLGAFGLLGRPPHSNGKFSASQRVSTTRIQSSLRDREVPRDGTDLMTSLCDEGGEDDGRRRRDVETAACLMLIRRRRWVIYFHCERNGENRQAWLAQGRCHSRGPETRRQSSASPAHGVSKAAFPLLPRLKAMWSPRHGPWGFLSTPGG